MGRKAKIPAKEKIQAVLEYLLRKICIGEHLKNQVYQKVLH